MLEPHSLCRDDGKRPDGLTVMPWANGRCLVWDLTCPDTLAASHLSHAVRSPGAVATDAESRKTVKYQSLASLYSFTPVAVETLGAIGQEAFAFFQDLGRRISVVKVARESRRNALYGTVCLPGGTAAKTAGTHTAGARTAFRRVPAHFYP